MSPTTDLAIRRSRDEDLPAVLELLGTALGWEPDDRAAALFAWKHHENPFGASPMWVAFDGDRLAGLRVLMRWEFERDGRVVSAVRAVDTATHPDYRGRGVFTALTSAAVNELRREGTAFVFNTPNDQSRPGYSKMGWREVGRLPVVARPMSTRGAFRMVRARTPAERWSAPTTGGIVAHEVLQDREALTRLLAARPATGRLRTRLTPELLAWRYASQILEYRAVVAPAGLEQGLALFRVRRRGHAREAALCDVIAAHHDEGTRRELVRRVIGTVDSDYVIAIDRRLVTAGKLVRLPRQGPLLTWRALQPAGMPSLADWDLRLGDIELF